MSINTVYAQFYGFVFTMQEMRPSETKFLIESGVTKLSVSPKSILSVREKAAESVVMVK